MIPSDSVFLASGRVKFLSHEPLREFPEAYRAPLRDVVPSPGGLSGSLRRPTETPPERVSGEVAAGVASSRVDAGWRFRVECLRGVLSSRVDAGSAFE